MVHKQDSTELFWSDPKGVCSVLRVDTKKDITKENKWDFVCKERTRMLKFCQMVIFTGFTCCVID